MGRDKAALPWGGTTLLGHACAVLAGCVDGPVVVVRSSGQRLPALPAAVRVVEDPQPHCGPVLGLATGLQALGADVEAAFVSATDLPFLHPAVVRRLLAELMEHPHADVAAAEVDGHLQPLAAAYRTAAASSVQRVLAAGERRLQSVVGGLRVRRLSTEDLLADDAIAAGDPQLRSFTNVNDPVEYAAAAHRRTH